MGFGRVVEWMRKGFRFRFRFRGNRERERQFWLLYFVDFEVMDGFG